jgi:hypothetical protein
VEPIAHQLKDEAILEIDEALITQRLRALFFSELRKRLVAEINTYAKG